MTERILVPKTPFETARPVQQRVEIAHVLHQLQPSTSGISPLSIFRNGTTRLFSHR